MKCLGIIFMWHIIVEADHDTPSGAILLRNGQTYIYIYIYIYIVRVTGSGQQPFEPASGRASFWLIAGSRPAARLETRAGYEPRLSVARCYEPPTVTKVASTWPNPGCLPRCLAAAYVREIGQKPVVMTIRPADCIRCKTYRLAARTGVYIAVVQGQEFVAANIFRLSDLCLQAADGPPDRRYPTWQFVRWPTWRYKVCDDWCWIH